MSAQEKVISGFTPEQASRLTGVSVNQLRAWDRSGFFEPSLAREDRSLPFARMYSFRDLLSLQILNTLRNESKVPLPHLREVRGELMAIGDDTWADTILYVLKKKVVFDHPHTGAREEVVGGQRVLGIPLEVVRANMRRKIDDDLSRDADDFGQIEKKRRILHNRPVFSGTRIPVDAVRAYIDHGASNEEIIREYPRLTDQDIDAVRKGSVEVA